MTTSPTSPSAGTIHSSSDTEQRLPSDASATNVNDGNQPPNPSSPTAPSQQVVDAEQAQLPGSNVFATSTMDDDAMDVDHPTLPAAAVSPDDVDFPRLFDQLKVFLDADLVVSPSNPLKKPSDCIPLQI